MRVIRQIILRLSKPNCSNTKKLADKPRWLVFNKIDTLSDEEAPWRAAGIVECIGWDGDYYLISAATGRNVPDLVRGDGLY